MTKDDLEELEKMQVMTNYKYNIKVQIANKNDVIICLNLLIDFIRTILYATMVQLIPMICVTVLRTGEQP